MQFIDNLSSVNRASGARARKEPQTQLPLGGGPRRRWSGSSLFKGTVGCLHHRFTLGLDNWRRRLTSSCATFCWRSLGRCACFLLRRLLNAAIAVSPENWKKKYPKELYNTYKEVPYRAHYLSPGKYHGFPDKPHLIPPKVREILRQRAQEEGYEEEFDEWMTREST